WVVASKLDIPVIFLLGLLLGLVSIFFAGLHATCEQQRRDASASILSNRAKAGEKAYFAVFLRPFFTTNKIKVEVPTGLLWTYTNNMQTRTYDLEATLRNALPMPVVALGKPGEVVAGAGRILTKEDSWKSDASALMRQASVIICIPSDQSGSRWELDEILRHQ